MINDFEIYFSNDDFCFFCFFFYYSYDYNEYEEEQYPSKSSNAIDMPETFGNAGASSSSSYDRNGSGDSYRDKKYK